MPDRLDRMDVDVLIHGGLVVTLDDEDRIYENGAVAVRGAEITHVGPAAEVQAQVAAETVIDATDTVVMPGLVNAHSHVAMTLFRGLADDMPLERWLDRIWKVEQTYATADNVRIGTELAFAEMIRGGATAVSDMYWHRDITTEVAKEVGFRLQDGPSFINFVGPDGIRPENRLAMAREYLERYADDPLIESCVQAHATYTVPRELLAQCRDLAAEFDVVFVTHAAESAAEVASVQEKFGQTPVRVLDDLGLLGPKTLLAHGVHLDDEEIALLAERETSIVHCPESNLKLGSGIARLPELLAAGVPLGLGTDGAASNNDLDMWGEMRTAAMIHKGVHEDPTVVPARAVLHMATSGSARAMGMAERIGSLAAGKCADLILVDLDRLHLTPRYDIISHLVYSANHADVRTVMIHGEFVMRDRELLTLDEAAVKARAREARTHISS